MQPIYVARELWKLRMINVMLWWHLVEAEEMHISFFFSNYQLIASANEKKLFRLHIVHIHK